MPHRSLLVAALITIVAPAPAFAAPFTVNYTFTGSIGDQPSEPIDSHPIGALLSDITRGAGINPVAGLDSINSENWTLGLAPDPLDFYEWTITPQPGYVMDVTGIVVTARRSDTGPRVMDLRTSLDGFTTAFFTVGFADVDGNTQLTMNNGAGIAGALDLTSAVTFRVYAYGAESRLGSFRLGIDANSANANLENIVQLSGDLTIAPTSVPEPASLVLLGTGLAGLAGRRYRRRTRF